MIASSESSGLHDEEYGFRPLTGRQFQSKSINSFNDMKVEGPLFGSVYS
jgi:hypothetical protein